jgi:hypothetical protein
MAIPSLTGVVFLVICFVYSSAFITDVLLRKQDEILGIISNPVFIGPCYVIGLLLYRLRCQSPLIYGCTELFTSSVTIMFSMASSRNSLLATSLGLLGGIYIMVRGLSNVDEGLPERRRERWRWNQWFQKRQRPGIASPSAVSKQSSQSASG